MIESKAVASSTVARSAAASRSPTAEYITRRSKRSSRVDALVTSCVRSASTSRDRTGVIARTRSDGRREPGRVWRRTPYASRSRSFTSQMSKTAAAFASNPIVIAKAIAKAVGAPPARRSICRRRSDELVILFARLFQTRVWEGDAQGRVIRTSTRPRTASRPRPRARASPSRLPARSGAQDRARRELSRRRLDPEQAPRRNPTPRHSQMKRRNAQS